MVCKQTIVITELCTHCKRLFAALKYYDMLYSAKMDAEERKALLVEFMETVHDSVLDDAAHFIKEHEGDLQRVWKEWTERYVFAKCSVSECAKSARHYGRGKRNGNERKQSGIEGDARYICIRQTCDIPNVRYFIPSPSGSLQHALEEVTILPL